MSATLSTLAGVAGGSVATYWLQRANDLRRERREAESAESAAQQATKRAARLVLTDLFTTIGHMRSSYEVKGWLLAMPLPDQAWQQERAQLSQSLTDQQWRDVATAFMNVSVWNDLMRPWRETDLIARWKGKARLPDNDEEGLSSMRASLLRTCGQAAESLRSLALPTIDEDDPLAVFFRDAQGA
jgi:hypothetical protein